MLTLLFLLDDSGLTGVDCRDVSQGNPGMGGTEYLFVALAHELTSRGLASATLAHFSCSNLYPASLPQVRLSGSIDTPWTAWEAAHALLTDARYIIVRGYNDPQRMARVIAAIPGSAPILVWAHNHLRWKTYSYLARCQRVCCVVFVGREQAALAAGAAGGFKSTCIPNGFYPPPPARPEQRSGRAVYIGNLAPSKGFHRLARLWPQIRRLCPGATLDVIGNGRLYGGDRPLGPLGLAEPHYEKRILAHLGNDPAKFGVVFHGKLGLGKFEMMRRSTVGLPNPTGFTECCPGSVLELSACGNAVVGPRRWGMCDTVIDTVTGHLCTSDGEYVRKAAALLANPEAALEMGRAGQEFVRENFAVPRICEQWRVLFEGLERAGVPVRKAAQDRPRGRYPLPLLRKPGSLLLSNLDRAHGWILRSF
jgi:glycosyltransferase involved in cell wall biosynthesis